MLTYLIKILSIPFIGTVLGAACVFVVKNGFSANLSRLMNSFAAGIMIAASVWSLIIPAIELCQASTFPFIPAAVGLWIGIFFFYILDKLLFSNQNKTFIAVNQQKQLMPLLAVIIHNIPEGMALGVVFTAWANGSDTVSYTAIVALALGIGAQNFPEGSIISLPLYGSGTSRTKAFFIGVISAVAEALGTIVTLMFSALILPLLPYLMCFAAGAMIFVVIEELCPEMNSEDSPHSSVLMFTLGFSVMMILDVALG